MKVTFDVKGFKELEQALIEELPKATARSVLRRTALQAMRPIEARAKALVPKDTGLLASLITTQVVKAKRKRGSVQFERSSGVAVRVGPTFGDYRPLKNPVPYKNKGVRAGQSRTYQIGSAPGVYGWFVEYGTKNTPPQPYIRPAFDGQSDNVVKAVGNLLTTEIGKAKQRIARRAAKAAKGK